MGTGTQHKLASGGINAATVTLVCFGLTTDSMEAEWAEHIVITLNLAATMRHTGYSFASEASIKDWSMR